MKIYCLGCLSPVSPLLVDCPLISEACIPLQSLIAASGFSSSHGDGVLALQSTYLWYFLLALMQ